MRTTAETIADFRKGRGVRSKDSLLYIGDILGTALKQEIARGKKRTYLQVAVKNVHQDRTSYHDAANLEVKVGGKRGKWK